MLDLLRPKPIVSLFICSLITFVLSFFYLSLIGFSFKDESPFAWHWPVPTLIQNPGGLIGSKLAAYSIHFYGIFAYVWPLALILSLGFWAFLPRSKSKFFRVLAPAFLFWILTILAPVIKPYWNFENQSIPISGASGLFWHLKAQEWIGITGLRLFTFIFLAMIATPPLSWVSLRLWRKYRRSPKLSAPTTAPNSETRTPYPDLVPELMISPSSARNLRPTPSSAYKKPPWTAFRTKATETMPQEKRWQEIKATQARLEQCLKDFGIEGKLTGADPGPVVTVYAFEPKAGTKIAKILALAEDIALALKVDAVFIYPLQAQTAVGIQVPNLSRETVFFGPLLRDKNFGQTPGSLKFIMGRSLSGESVVSDLATMPHLLVAGQTGSGKSVFINTLICSLLSNMGPRELRFILVDPKILELKVYEGIPQLLLPVITEPKKAHLALSWAIEEMERRYQLLELAKLRHMSAFNDMWQKATLKTKDELRLKTKLSNLDALPHIVIIIDEMADLMLTAPREMEQNIQRLAQKARASGIHLVLATQRPSVDVITGVIKANLPCRVAFKVFSRADARTILDSMGAEKLLGKGDMLFLKPGQQRLERIQAPFLSDEEVIEFVDDLKAEGQSLYDQTAIEWIEKALSQSHPENLNIELSAGDDPKWAEALSIAKEQGYISASYLQRALKIGYNRAARMVESMQKKGLVESQDGPKPRKWLGPEESL